MLVGAFSLLVRFLVVLLFVRLLLRFLAGIVRGLSGERAPDTGRARGARAVDLVRCSACGTHVPEDRALIGSGPGKPRRFCSSACRDHGTPSGDGAASARPVHLE